MLSNCGRYHFHSLQTMSLKHDGWTIFGPTETDVVKTRLMNRLETVLVCFLGLIIANQTNLSIKIFFNNFHFSTIFFHNGTFRTFLPSHLFYLVLEYWHHQPQSLSRLPWIHSLRQLQLIWRWLWNRSQKPHLRVEASWLEACPKFPTTQPPFFYPCSRPSSIISVTKHVEWTFWVRFTSYVCGVLGKERVLSTT